MATQAKQASGGTKSWVFPLVLLVVVVGLFLGHRKHEEVTENPFVDLAIITVAVFAFAFLFRWAAAKFNQPGVATFFGAPVNTQA